MELTAFTLILVAAISHAVWNAVAKSAVGNPLTFVWAYLCLGALVLLPVTTIFLWEQGWPSDPHLIYTPLVSGVLHLIYLLTLQTAYRKGDLGVVYPTARGVGPLLTMIVAIGVIGERPRPSALMGALIIFAGILLVATASQGHGQGRGQGHTHWLSEGVLWGGATGVAISTYTLWDNRAMTVWDLDPLPFFTLALTTQALLLTPFALRQPNKHLRENWWRIT